MNYYAIYSSAQVYKFTKKCNIHALPKTVGLAFNQLHNCLPYWPKYGCSIQMPVLVKSIDLKSWNFVPTQSNSINCQYFSSKALKNCTNYYQNYNRLQTNEWIFKI